MSIFKHKPKPDPLVIKKLEFGSITIVAHCWCSLCGWELYPTGWYDEEGPITLDEVVSIWQDDHDGLMDIEGPEEDQCTATITWRELT